MRRLHTARAHGLLAAFDRAGVLAPADVHVAQRLGALTGEQDERVLLAVALTVRGTRQGSVVLDLADAASTITAEADEAGADTPAVTDVGDTGATDEPLAWPDPDAWVAACRASPLVRGGPGATGVPLRQVGTRLWLDRYWRQELAVADDLLRRCADRPDDIDPAALRADLDSLFTDAGTADQRRAVAVAALSRISVIAGGPGTGKTTTVAQLIAVLHRRLGPSLRVALAAPTGKAAARLEEAVHAAAGPLDAADRAVLARLGARTLHRLLGRRPGSSSRFKHDRDHHLPYDVVVVDESSMVPLTMMARLVEALAPATRLVLVGDPDQLASVEAGAVLGDLVDPDDVGPVTDTFRQVLAPALDDLPSATRPQRADAELRSSVAMLTTVRRTAGARVELARLVRSGAADATLAFLRAQPEGVVFHEVDDELPVPPDVLAAVRRSVVAHESALAAAAEAGDAEGALDALDGHRLLCAHRAGARGVEHWTALAQRWFVPEPAAPGAAQPGDPAADPAAYALDGHYAGRPLLVTANDYDIDLYNGDTGVVVRREPGSPVLEAAFRSAAGVRRVPLVRLGDVRPVHAMTVHKAQGSQFGTVTVVMPLAASPLATRQTFYTAITRAIGPLHVVGSAESVLACVARPIARATGLRDRLLAPLEPEPAGP
ncbi:exodeoxyribonuclease V subunit alpha [Jatrophihabitans fulvus]